MGVEFLKDFIFSACRRKGEIGGSFGLVVIGNKDGSVVLVSSGFYGGGSGFCVCLVCFDRCGWFLA